MTRVQRIKAALKPDVHASGYFLAVMLLISVVWITIEEGTFQGIVISLMTAGLAWAFHAMRKEIDRQSQLPRCSECGQRIETKRAL